MIYARMNEGHVMLFGATKEELNYINSNYKMQFDRHGQSNDKHPNPESYHFLSDLGFIPVSDFLFYIKEIELPVEFNGDISIG